MILWLILEIFFGADSETHTLDEIERYYRYDVSAVDLMRANIRFALCWRLYGWVTDECKLNNCSQKENK